MGGWMTEWIGEWLNEQPDRSEGCQRVFLCISGVTPSPPTTSSGETAVQFSLDNHSPCSLSIGLSESSPISDQRTILAKETTEMRLNPLALILELRQA